MIESAEGILLVASVILIFSVFAGKAGYRFGLPALLLFLGVGMLFGSDGLGIYWCPGVEYYPVLGWYGYEGCRNQTHCFARDCPGNGRRFTDYIHYRRIYLCYFDDGIEVCYLDFSGIVVIGGGYVVNRFGFGFLHSA